MNLKKEERTVKDVLVTDKYFWPVLQNQLFAYLQAANDVNGFSRPSSF
jgi:hypothetical protein